MRMTKRRWGGIAVATLIVAAAAWALVPDPLEVDVARVTWGPLEVSIVEDGITRIRERYEVAAPVAGRLLRVEVTDQIVTDRIINELMGKDASARFRFIMDRAEEAEELDV